MPVVTAKSIDRYGKVTGMWEIEYDLTQNPRQGGMKKVFLSKDGRWALQFFINPEKIDIENMRKRLNKILGAYNICLSDADGGLANNSKKSAEYFKEICSWPVAVTDDPKFGFGIICPTFPKRFLYPDDAFNYPATSKAYAGRERDCRWYLTPNTRKSLNSSEQLNFRQVILICLHLARTIGKLHMSGLAHTDISCNNVLIDVKNSKACLLLDIDGLAVPGLYPPEVHGTPGYIAPEVLTTKDLPFGNPQKFLPCIDTDKHAMAVLFYQLMLMRHPLSSGKLIFDINDPNNDEYLMMGPKALFVENPTDTRNNLPMEELVVSIHDLGKDLERLFLKAFVEGLHNPGKRPRAIKWEEGLSRSFDILQPCANKKCPSGWFILHDTSKPVCPFCETRAKNFMRLHLKIPVTGKRGHWKDYWVINLYDELKLFKWHFFHPCKRGAGVAPAVYASIHYSGQGFTLKNECLQSFFRDNDNPIRIGESVRLYKGLRFITGRGDNALLLEVQ